MTSRIQLTAEDKYQLLLRISHRIRGTLDLAEILNHLLDDLRTILDYDAAGIFVLSEDVVTAGYGHPRQMIAGMATRGFDPRPPETDPMLRLGKGIVGHVIRTGECIVVGDVRSDPRYIVGRSKTLSEIAVPIEMDDRPIGALNIESDTIGAYGDCDLEVLRFFADAASISIEKAMLHRKLILQKGIEDQLRIAREVQSGLLPGGPPDVEGYEIAGVSIPTYEIGGDYFDYIRLTNERLGVVVADVSGKGIPAAMIMSAFRAVLWSHARNGSGLTRIMDAMNRLLGESTGPAAYVTSVYGVLDPIEGRFQYSNCGHNPPMLIRADGRIEDLESGGPPLGMFQDALYQTGDVRLESGDMLVLYTDGVIEAGSQGNGGFGPERLAQIVTGSRELTAPALIRQVVQATRQFSESTDYDDDFTLVVIRRQTDSSHQQ